MRITSQHVALCHFIVWLLYYFTYSFFFLNMKRVGSDLSSQRKFINNFSILFNRTKLKQTEVDFELLKKCCETLKEENRRLQKELQELKAMKLVAPPQLYMQLPAATLTMCPSCERFNGGAGENSTKISFSIGSKPHFYNPFTNHPSAAC